MTFSQDVFSNRTLALSNEQTSNLFLAQSRGESLGNQLFESKKDSNTQKVKIVIRIGTKQPYFGIKIFGQLYQYNLALVPSNTRVKFPRFKMTKLLPFESPKKLKRLVA